MKMGAVEFVDTVVNRARVLGASDIHIDPFSKATHVRFRIDGLLRTITTIPPPLHSEVIARVKILAGLRTDIHQTSQDGRFRYVQGDCDIRVSTLPTQYGENVVMRILTKRSFGSSGNILAELGVSVVDIKNIETALKRRRGLIVVTGPTGSGKTTTLYALLTMLNSGTVSIVTLEDPIEYAIEGVRQVQVNHKYGMSFVTGLRAILRQDPDIIMIGEIRDSETAKIAVHSALTGHLVISTLHTENACAAIPRLMDMGIDPYLISATLSLVVGQKLLRLICRECRVARDGADSLDGTRLPACKNCSMTGYKGRIGIYESLLVDEHTRKAILDRVALDNVISLRTMNIDAIEKIAQGLTSREELTRVLYEQQL